MIDLLIPEAPDARFRLISAQWVDGTDDLADTFSAQLAWDGDDITPLLDDNHALILAGTGPTRAVFGPYELDPVSIAGEEELITVSGRTGLYFEDAVAAISDIHGLYEGIQGFLRQRIEAQHEPWFGWYQGQWPLGALLYEEGSQASLLFQQLVDLGDLPGVRGALDQWGMTVVPRVSPATPGVYTAQVLSEYPFVAAGAGPDAEPVTQVDGLATTAVQTGGRRVYGEIGRNNVLDLTGPRPHWWEWEVDQRSPSFPERGNRPEFLRTRTVRTWRHRRIEGTLRKLLQGFVGPTFLAVGSTGPPEYIRHSRTFELLKQDEERTRWRMQNESCRLTLSRVLVPEFEDDPASLRAAFPASRQLVRLAAQDLPRKVRWPDPSEWLVRDVHHSWDETKGYHQALTCTLWHGPFVRRDPALVS